MVKADSVGAILTNVAAYGGQLAAVFQNYSLITERIPRGFEGAINTLNTTVATLNQVLTLLKDEAEGKGKKLFSDDGLTYVHLLAKECGATLAKVEPIIAEGCLSSKERTKLQKSNRQRCKKSKPKKPEPGVDVAALKLDEKDFLEKVEKTRWSWAIKDVEECMERLHDLQLYLLLVFQVVTVGALSRDM